MNRARLLAAFLAALLSLPAMIRAESRDSTAQDAPPPFEGLYRDPRGAKITIEVLAPGIYHLVSTAGWEGAGLLQGKRFDGVVHMSSRPGWRTQQVIRIRDDGDLEVRTIPEGADQGTFELWKRCASCAEPREEYPYVEDLPSVMTKVPAVYPEAAMRAGIQGTVMLQARVREDGWVDSTRVLRSIPQLDAAAVAAVKQWRFKPALAGGKPVTVWVGVPVKFSLH